MSGWKEQSNTKQIIQEINLKLLGNKSEATSDWRKTKKILKQYQTIQTKQDITKQQTKKEMGWGRLYT